MDFASAWREIKKEKKRQNLMLEHIRNLLNLFNSMIDRIPANVFIKCFDVIRAFDAIINHIRVFVDIKNE